MALNGLFCADVPLRNYSLTHSRSRYSSCYYGCCCQSWCGHATWKHAWSCYRDQSPETTVNRSAL